MVPQVIELQHTCLRKGPRDVSVQSPFQKQYGGTKTQGRSSSGKGTEAEGGLLVVRFCFVFCVLFFGVGCGMVWFANLRGRVLQARFILQGLRCNMVWP
jgi:hypothetical protein